jgi:hypothetical protein
MKKNIKKILSVIVVTILATVGLFVGLRSTPPEKCSIWIDASRSLSIKPPMGIFEIGPNGEPGLHLPAEAGRGWKGEAGGEAMYQFYAPQKGTYTIWAYCLWHDECTNAVYVQVDDSSKSILGNDPVFGNWHWVKGFGILLEKGFHRLTLSNHSPNIAIMKIMLTNDPLQTPPDADPSLATVLFTDGFNGCDRGNFPLWRKVSGTWELKNPTDDKNYGDLILTGVSEDSALIVYDRESWQGIRLEVFVFCDSQADPNASFGIRYSMDGENDYQEIMLSPVSNGQEAMVRHVRCRSGTIETLAEGRIPWRKADWHELHLDLGGRQPNLVLDGGASFKGGQSGPCVGGIGFSLHGPITASFDNVLVRSAGDE